MNFLPRRTMNIVWLFCALLSLGLRGDFRKSPPWITSLTKYIAEETNARQVLLMSSLDSNEWIESPVIDELFRKIVQKFPTVRINIESLEEPKSSLSDSEIEDHSTTDTSETFFIIVHESRKIAGLLPTERLIDALLPISTLKLHSKFLLVQISSAFSDTFEDLLRYAWTKQMLDFTLVELVQVQAPRKLIGISDSVATPIVHQLNAFKRMYSRIKWNLSTEWFPDKVANMWGHPLKIGVINAEPFSRVTFNDDLEPMEVGGANIVLLENIAWKLNFSMKYLPKLDKFLDFSPSSNTIGFYNFLEAGKMDILAYLAPHHSESMKRSTMRTVPIRVDELCPIVPVLPRVEIPFPTNSFVAYLCSVVIVTIFWVLRSALKFEGRFWQPFNILRVLFGVSAIKLPTRISDRTLCACLLAVSAIYSSHIYESLTDISLQTNVEMKFETFEDLDNSGLVPIMHPYLFNKTFLYADDQWMINIRDKTLRDGGQFYVCPYIAARYKNVTCLTRRDKAKGAVDSINHSGQDKIKIAKCCFWTDSISFLLAQGSPYRSSINGIIRGMQNGGLIKHIYDDTKFNISRNSNDARKDSGLDNKQNMQALRQQLVAIAMVGYSLSLLVFIAEIVVDRALKYKRRNRGFCVNPTRF